MFKEDIVERPAPSESIASSEIGNRLRHLFESDVFPRLLSHSARNNRQSFVAELSSRLTSAPYLSMADLEAILPFDQPLTSLLLDHLAPTADRLGHLWEDDTCDFLAVTLGLGRLQALTRQLCAAREVYPPSSGRRILLMPSPGESHVYGLMIVESVFRQSGWAAEVLAQGDNPIRCLHDGAFDALGVSLASDIHRPALRAILPELRRASDNPDLCVIVGGSAILGTDLRREDLDADACLPDVRDAPAFVEAWIDEKRGVRPSRRTIGAR